MSCVVELNPISRVIICKKTKMQELYTITDYCRYTHTHTHAQTHTHTHTCARASMFNMTVLVFQWWEPYAQFTVRAFQPCAIHSLSKWACKWWHQRHQCLHLNEYKLVLSWCLEAVLMCLHVAHDAITCKPCLTHGWRPRGNNDLLPDSNLVCSVH